LLLGEWTQAFLDECEQWPDSKHKDQIDATAGAFNRWSAKPPTTPTTASAEIFKAGGYNVVHMMPKGELTTLPK
jgi:hypothetical protein